jgi:hypothetical protein
VGATTEATKPRRIRLYVQPGGVRDPIKLSYSTDEILSEHPYATANRAPGGDCSPLLHGGYDDAGIYVSPRTLERWPAIRNWQASLAAKGNELIDASTEILVAEHFPNHAQMKLLLDSGINLPLWRSLTTTGIVEGYGRMLADITAPDFASIVVEDISGTATAHLNKGLLVAHGLDEGGSDGAPGAHDRMWFTARDMLFGPSAYTTPDMPARAARRRQPGITRDSAGARGFDQAIDGHSPD